MNRGSLIFTAVMFLTRFPVPSGTQHGAFALAKSVRWWPLVGWLLGMLTGLMIVAARYIMPPLAASFGGIAGAALMTGCLHEDAFADLCDGFGGWTPARRLEIMRDSRVGSYGVMGLILVTGLRASLITAMNPFALVFSCAAAMAYARWTAVLLLKIGDAPTDANSLAAPFSNSISWFDLLLGAVLLLPTMIVAPSAILELLVAAVLIATVSARFFAGFTGGITGDCAGAVILICEIIGLLLLRHANLATSPIALLLRQRFS